MGDPKKEVSGTIGHTGVSVLERVSDPTQEVCVSAPPPRVVCLCTFAPPDWMMGCPRPSDFARPALSSSTAPLLDSDSPEDDVQRLDGSFCTCPGKHPIRILLLTCVT